MSQETVVILSRSAAMIVAQQMCNEGNLTDPDTDRTLNDVIEAESNDDGTLTVWGTYEHWSGSVATMIFVDADTVADHVLTHTEG